jgi:hypothetical protein
MVLQNPLPFRKAVSAEKMGGFIRGFEGRYPQDVADTKQKQYQDEKLRFQIFDFLRPDCSKICIFRAEMQERRQ